MKVEMAASVGMMALSGVTFLGQPVEVPLGAIVGLAILPTAELSAASAEVLNNLKRRFKHD